MDIVLCAGGGFANRLALAARLQGRFLDLVLPLERRDALQILRQNPPSLLLVWEEWGEDFVRACREALPPTTEIVVLAETAGNAGKFLQAGASRFVRCDQNFDKVWK